MKKFPAASTLCLIALVAAPLFALAVETGDTVEGTPPVTRTPVTDTQTNMPGLKKPECRELWYRDNNTPTCQQKKFCGAFMYQGLMTFPTEEACKAIGDVKNRPAVGGNPSQTDTGREKVANRSREDIRQATAAAQLKENIAQFKAGVEAKRTEAVEKFKQKRDEFKAKVAAIKDEKKKALAEKIDGKITQINTNRTEEMSRYIGKMKDLLGKIQAKSDELKGAGTDTTAVEAAIKAAQTAVDSAAAAVTAQAGKQYVAALTSETALKNNFGSIAKQLELDLKTVRQLLINAQKAIANAAKVLGQARGVEGSTPSATPKE